MIVYLAGCEGVTQRYNVDLPLGSSMFCSYFERKQSESFLSWVHEQPHRIITVDSGAHSFFSTTGIACGTQKRGGKLPEPDIYLRSYIEWIKVHWEKIDYFVELDIQSIVGLPKVLEWRRLLRSEGIFSKCITVHHACDTDEDFLRSIEESESHYVGLEGLRGGVCHLDYMKLIRMCYDRSTKVHGFGLTSGKWLLSFPFYSVDSSSWLNPAKYGGIPVINEFGMVRYVTGRKDNFFEHNYPVEFIGKLSGTEYRTRLNYQLIEHTKMEKQITRIWQSRGIDWDEQLQKLQRTSD
jgi:hypothetical protein